MPLPQSVVLASNLKRIRCNESLPRRQNTTALVADLMENAIPQTTTLINRMYKRSSTPAPSASVIGSNGTKIAAGGSGNRGKKVSHSF